MARYARVSHVIFESMKTRKKTYYSLLVALVALIIIFYKCASVIKLYSTLVVPLGTSSKPKQSSDGFPKLFHQVWYPWSPNGTLPHKWKQASDDCGKLNPSYKHKVWNYDDIEKLVKTEFPDFYSTYHGYEFNTQRTDAARLMILARFGGVYLDMDIKCRTPFDNIIGNFTGYEAMLHETDPVGTGMDFIAAKSNSPFFKYVTNFLPGTGGSYGLPYITVMMGVGPMGLSIWIQNYPNKSQICTITQRQFEDVYFVNMKGQSWHNWDAKYIKFIYLHIIKPAFIILMIILTIYIVYHCYLRFKRRNS